MSTYNTEERFSKHVSIGINDVWTCGYMNQYIKLVERYLDSELIVLGTLVWATQQLTTNYPPVSEPKAWTRA